LQIGKSVTGASFREKKLMSSFDGLHRLSMTHQRHYVQGQFIPLNRAASICSRHPYAADKEDSLLIARRV